MTQASLATHPTLALNIGAERRACPRGVVPRVAPRSASSSTPARASTSGRSATAARSGRAASSATSPARVGACPRASLATPTLFPPRRICMPQSVTPGGVAHRCALMTYWR